ncbi:MAG: isoprenyl transferase [Flammeovirgaceae bacterium]
MKELVDIEKLPKHIAIIMDGNGRWAKKKGAKRVFGHQNAIKAVRETTETCAELGVKYLTLYAFSTENWNRPKLEVSALMRLLVSTIRKETKTLIDNDVKLHAIGNLEALPKDCQRELQEAMEITKDNKRMTLTLALSYSGRWDMLEAAKKLMIAAKNGEIQPEQLDEQAFSMNLSTTNMPDPELLIRTSGELRISNFLLWQLAYAELFFTDLLWPDFRKEHLIEAIQSYQSRERRFGKTSEQVS